jgi:flagellar hook-associated protein 3 FlgL
MSQRITDSMLTGATLADINSSLGAMNRSENELSSGKTILAPSDNPYGASKAIGLQSTLDGLSAYAGNVQDGTSWLNTASSSMTSISNVTQRVRELLVSASNGVNNQTDLNGIADEVDQLTESVKQDANTQYAGQYIFSGTATSTAPYEPGATDTFQGNTATVSRAISPGSTVNISTDLSSVLGNGSEPGDGKLLDVLRTISKNLKGGTPADLSALSSTDLNNLETNINNLTQLQAHAGAVTNQLQMAGTRIEDLENTSTQELSATENADIAKTSIKYSNQQAAYDAALRAGASIVQESLLNFLH